MQQKQSDFPKTPPSLSMAAHKCYVCGILGNVRLMFVLNIGRI